MIAFMGRIFLYSSNLFLNFINNFICYFVYRIIPRYNIECPTVKIILFCV